MWVVCVYFREAAGAAAGAYMSCERNSEKNYWADFNVIWQECCMVHSSYLINFWLTLTYFQGSYRSLT
jgi:hypothetical protein